jgi:galactonate dehydratase
MIEASSREVSGWAECALTMGQPAASADAVSPPATPNGSGKLDAAKTATGPSGTTTKSLRLPLYQTLGGAVRDRVRLYDHLGGGNSDDVYGTGDVNGFFERAKRCVEDRFGALKILAVPMGNGLANNRDLSYAASVMSAVREAVRDDVDIMVDFHGRTTPAAAISFATVLEPFKPWFIEEPCQPENVASMAQIARAVTMPVATGERLGGRSEVLRVLQAQACAVLQSDVCHCGGITELRKIASMADTYNVAMAPHNPLGPIATAVNVHVGFATPNFLIQEVMRTDVAWRDDIVTNPLRIVDGHVLPPTEPGIGVEVNEREARKHPYQPEPILSSRDSYGTVVDW